MKKRTWRLVERNPVDPGNPAVVPIKGGIICWYTPENYPRIAELVTEYPATYEEWRANTEEGMARVIAQKMPVPEKVLIDVDKAIPWCMANYGRVDRASLLNYAVYRMEYGDILDRS